MTVKKMILMLIGRGASSAAAFAIAFGLTLAVAETARAQCDASCAVAGPIQPNVFTVGNQATIEVQLRANTSSTGFPIFTPVAAELNCVAGAVGANGTCCVAINCIGSQNCVEDPAQVIPDLFTNIACNILDPMVTSCSITDLPGGVQAACFEATTTLPAGFNAIPGIQLIEVTADAADAAASFQVVADLQFGSLVTDDAGLCPVAEVGGCEGSASASVVPVCEVQIDRQVSCDGGGSFVDDMNTDDPNNAATRSCSTAPGDLVVVDYLVTNPGGDTLVDCVLTDSNGTLGPPADPAPFDLLPGGSFPFTRAPICSDAAGGEPGTATVVCDCAAAAGPVDASDTASFMCSSVPATSTWGSALLAAMLLAALSLWTVWHSRVRA